MVTKTLYMIINIRLDERTTLPASSQRPRIRVLDWMEVESTDELETVGVGLELASRQVLSYLK
jgi:hypothetical protein